MSVRPSVSMSFCGNLICGNLNRPIDPKIGMNVGYRVVHVENAWFFEIQIASFKFMQFAFFCKQICVHGFDWSIDLILLKIDIHVRFTMTHVWKRWFFNTSIGSCKLMKLAIFWQI